LVINIFYQIFVTRPDEKVFALYTIAQTCFEKLEKLEVVIGDHIFELIFDVPYIFKSLPDLQELQAGNKRAGETITAL